MKRLSRKIGLLCGISLCAMVVLAGSSMPVYASEAVVAETNDNARSTILEWVYKYIDGVLMMRLYNHSTGEWVGDWIPAD